MASENRVRAIDVVPEPRRAWVKEDAGFRKLFEILDLAGPSKAMSLQTAAELAMRSHGTFKRDFPAVAGRPWGAFHREWRLCEAQRLLGSPLVAPQQARNDVGLRSSGKFSAAFRRRFGVTPREMRQKREGTERAE
jgi:AraC-like DNA-binding protein